MKFFNKLSIANKLAFISLIITIITLLVTIIPKQKDEGGHANIIQSTYGQQSPTINTSEKVNITYNNSSQGENNKISNKIEFTDILNTFTVPEDTQGNIAALDWGIGASEDSKINWLHPGLKFIDSDLSEKEREFLPKTFGSIIRKGTASITNNGIPSHTILEEKLKAVDWDITMFGVFGGADIVTLSNNVSAFGYEDNDGSLKIPKQYLKKEELLCESNEILTEWHKTLLSEVKLPQKRLIWIVTNSYCGGNKPNCNYNYAIFLQIPRKEEITELTVDCLDAKEIGKITLDERQTNVLNEDYLSIPLKQDEVPSLWKFLGTDVPPIELHLNSNGTLTFKGGFEFYNPGSWLYNDQTSELKLSLPKMKIQELISASQDNSIRMDAENKSIYYYIDKNTKEIYFLGFLFEKQ